MSCGRGGISACAWCPKVRCEELAWTTGVGLWCIRVSEWGQWGPGGVGEIRDGAVVRGRATDVGRRVGRAVRSGDACGLEGEGHGADDEGRRQRGAR